MLSGADAVRSRVTFVTVAGGGGGGGGALAAAGGDNALDSNTSQITMHSNATVMMMLRHWTVGARCLCDLLSLEAVRRRSVYPSSFMFPPRQISRSRCRPTAGDFSAVAGPPHFNKLMEGDNQHDKELLEEVVLAVRPATTNEPNDEEG
jgi:hypothetical protein